ASGAWRILAPSGVPQSLATNGDAKNALAWPRRSWTSKQKPTSSGTSWSTTSRGAAESAAGVARRREASTKVTTRGFIEDALAGGVRSPSLRGRRHGWNVAAEQVQRTPPGRGDGFQTVAHALLQLSQRGRRGIERDQPLGVRQRHFGNQGR